MERVVPRAELVAVVAPSYPKGEGVRPTIGLERMLRIYFLQQWFNLSDPAAEEALYDSAAMRRFVGIDKRSRFSSSKAQASSPLPAAHHWRRRSINVRNLSDMTDKCPLTPQSIAPPFLLAHRLQQTLVHKSLQIALDRLGGNVWEKPLPVGFQQAQVALDEQAA
jgi:hypothetical protein